MKMFDTEFAAKQDIVRSLADAEKREVAMVYIASWQMEPCVDYNRIEDIIKALQIECGK